MPGVAGCAVTHVMRLNTAYYYIRYFIIIIIIYKENARARGYDLLGPAYLGGQGFGYGGRCREEVV